MDSSRAMAVASVRRRRPDAVEDEARWRLSAQSLGSELACEAYSLLPGERLRSEGTRSHVWPESLILDQLTARRRRR